MHLLNLILLTGTINLFVKRSENTIITRPKATLKRSIHPSDNQFMHALLGPFFVPWLAGYQVKLFQSYLISPEWKGIQALNLNRRQKVLESISYLPNWIAVNDVCCPAVLIL